MLVSRHLKWYLIFNNCNHFRVLVQEKKNLSVFFADVLNRYGLTKVFYQLNVFFYRPVRNCEVAPAI